MLKPKIEIIVPADVCSCSYSIWINKVWDKLHNYKEKIDIETLTSNSSRAKELKVSGRTIICNGKVIPLIELENNLSKIFYEF
jgi:hypothetical protein